MKNKQKKWTDEDVDLLQRLYPHGKSEMLAKMLGRSVTSVISKAFSLGIKKTDEFLKRQAKERAASCTTLFKKGHIPFNKGLKQTEFMSLEQIAKCVETQFKKGGQPHVEYPDGTIRIRREKSGVLYAYIRLSKAKWDLLHKVNWIKKHGKYNTRTHCLWCLTDDTTNGDPNNWELITRKENLRRNAEALPPDLLQLKKLNTKLKNIIAKHDNK